MKVAVYYNNKDVRIEELPIPKISSKELLVKVHACGICGSDVLEWYRIKKAPKVLGHEMSGEVVEIGSSVKGYKKGDRVFVTHHVACDDCHYCKNGHHTACHTLHTTNFHPGGFSEYLRVPEINILKGTFLLPKEINYEEGTFIEPLGCVVRAQRVMGVKTNNTMLVLGSGMSGLLHIALAKVKGLKVIATDVSKFKLDFAKKVGADEVINAKEYTPEKLKKLNGSRLADFVVVCAGSLAAVTQALVSVDKGGTIMFFATPSPGEKVEVPINDFWRDEITLKTSYAAVKEDLEEAIELLKKKKIDVNGMITHRLPLEKTQEGFDLVAEGKNSIKVVIEPDF